MLQPTKITTNNTALSLVATQAYNTATQATNTAFTRSNTESFGVAIGQTFKMKIFGNAGTVNGVDSIISHQNAGLNLNTYLRTLTFARVGFTLTGYENKATSVAIVAGVLLTQNIEVTAVWAAV